jgi:hypothetical protein
MEKNHRAAHRRGRRQQPATQVDTLGRVQLHLFIPDVEIGGVVDPAVNIYIAPVGGGTTCFYGGIQTNLRGFNSKTDRSWRKIGFGGIFSRWNVKGLDAARRLLDEVVASGRPREPQAALLNLGELYAVEGHVEAARAYLESARGVDATRPEPLYALSLLASARGEPAQATAFLREAVRLDDGSGRAALIFAYGEELL